MSDFDSDLTEIDDEEEVPLSQSQSTSKKADGDGYKIKGALNAPRATKMLEQGDINLEADYQRDIVWHPTKQTGLIDSIFKNFYVPPVIFAVTYSSDGTEKRVCIDGKQRLTSIWKFMQGTIPFKDSLSGEKFYYKENVNRAEKGKIRILPDKYRKVFRTKQIVCVEYSDLNPDSEREIFQRVQLGVALNAAEKLQAIHSSTSIFIRDILADFIHDDLETSLQWDTSRANDFRCVATAVFLMEKWPCPLASVPALTKWLHNRGELEDTFREDVRAAFKTFSVMARSKEFWGGFRMEDTKERKSKAESYIKVSPVEFIMSSVLIYLFMDKLTMSQLSDAIQRMRLDVRSQETDIRTNNRVYGILQRFIKDLKPSKGEEAEWTRLRRGRSTLEVRHILDYGWSVVTRAKVRMLEDLGDTYNFGDVPPAPFAVYFAALSVLYDLVHAPPMQEPAVEDGAN
ncbi:hypothetical protein NM688_g2916 [Phlebia brevispora]|uniref:Uncharacterized protein n=1 Tax=Phlebia brevispora TaxID=194682 RepID=A0ACC1T7G4_9APHY|nr:hypothetical protein NM688_g2916 [Phlebia brevispora]